MWIPHLVSFFLATGHHFSEGSPEACSVRQTCAQSMCGKLLFVSGIWLINHHYGLISVQKRVWTFFPWQGETFIFVSIFSLQITIQRAGRPLVLNLGSVTWPPFMAKPGKYLQNCLNNNLWSLQEKFGIMRQNFCELADFVTVYIAEAHPAEKRHLTHNLCVGTHKNLEDRWQVLWCTMYIFLIINFYDCVL